jgi:hypothetical protein
MTTQVTLRLPGGGTRRYHVGTRVRILSECPQFSTGGPGTITAFPDRYSVVVQPDVGGDVVGPISADSIYLTPLS